jgi:drug/metabolite transporter (DMT)-like permease
MLFAFWFGSQYFYSLGLVTTSVSSSTIISNTSMVFVLFLETVVFNDNRMTHNICVAVCLVGIIIVVLTDSEN